MRQEIRGQTDNRPKLFQRCWYVEMVTIPLMKNDFVRWLLTERRHNGLQTSRGISAVGVKRKQCRHREPSDQVLSVVNSSSWRLHARGRAWLATERRFVQLAVTVELQRMAEVGSCYFSSFLSPFSLIKKKEEKEKPPPRSFTFCRGLFIFYFHFVRT